MPGYVHTGNMQSFLPQQSHSDIPVCADNTQNAETPEKKHHRQHFTSCEQELISQNIMKHFLPAWTEALWIASPPITATLLW